MLTGPVGKIKWAYYVAADVHGFTVVRNRQTKQLSLSGVLGESNSYNLAQRPLTFIAPYKDGEWRWPIESITIEHHIIRATLGPMETTTTGYALTGAARGNRTS